MERDVHADHVLGRIELELQITIPIAQVFAARPPRLRHSVAVASKLRQAASVTATVIVRSASVVSGSTDRYGGLGRSVLLHAGVYLAYAVYAEVEGEPAVVLARAWSTCVRCVRTDREEEKKKRRRPRVRTAIHSRYGQN